MSVLIKEEKKKKRENRKMEENAHRYNLKTDQSRVNERWIINVPYHKGN